MNLRTLTSALGLSLTVGLALLLAESPAHAAPPELSDLRPPAVPLIANDPYFSVWSEHDRLTDGDTTHWTGKPHRMTSLVRVDGTPYRLMGEEPEGVDAMEQTRLTVLPTRSIYEFAGNGVAVTLTFTTPLLPEDLTVCSRPLTYLTWSVRSTDGAKHDVDLYFDASSEFAVNTPDQAVVATRETVGKLTALRVGTELQPVLETSGDDVRIDWGYFYVASDSNTSESGLVPGPKARFAFATGKELPEDMPSKATPVEDGAPVLAFTFALGEIGDGAVQRRVMLAYDDLYSIRYFNVDLRPYWRKDGAEAADLLKVADAEYDELAERCEVFDDEVVADLMTVGGLSYVKIGVLSYRQALAAQKLCADANGQPIMMSKENNSNGCIATVDVLYPAAPQMLVFSPTMLKASLLPLMQFSASKLWNDDAAPHDLGTYPLATGQVYGSADKSAMPVEECGNMLVMLAALSTVEGDASFANEYWPTITQWYDYLVENGLDPANQLSTDDFAGHLARNANLSAKAIMGIAAYGRMAEMTGRTAEADKAMDIARDYTRQWMELADAGDHYVLAFGEPDTWSQKYNFVWDELLGFDVVPDEVIDREHAFYRTKMNKYGLPLDNRRAYTKLDWEVWTATMANDPADFQRIIDTLAVWADETPTRVPLTDWYDTLDGRQTGFKARSVVGGNFIGLMRDEAIWKKYASRDTMKVGDWVPIDIDKPEMTVLSGTADEGEPATWRYTTREPATTWWAVDFDDSGWREGQAGFGRAGTPSAEVGTTWDTSDIYLRRSFTLPSDIELDAPRIWMSHDEGVEVYINGVRALERRGFRNAYSTYAMSPEAAATLKPGRNTIAVHCNQTSGGQYVDVGLVNLVETKSQ